MNIDTFVTNIESYTIQELLTIYNLQVTFNKRELETYHHFLLTKFSQYPELLYFFEKCKNKLLEYYYENHILEGQILENEDNKVSLHKNQNVIIKEKVYTPFSMKQESTNEYITKLIIINSKFRLNFETTQSNNFIIDLPYPLTKVTSVKLKSIETVNSHYALSDHKKNNQFIINGDLITVPQGNYTSIELISELNTLLTPYNISVLFDDFTANVTISSNSSTNFILNFIINNLDFYNTFGYILGFRTNPIDISYSYVGESVLDIRGEKYFYVYLDDYVNNGTYDNIICLKKHDFFFKNIIGRIPNVSDIYHIQFEDNSDNIDKIRFYFGCVNLKKLNIRLLDSQGELFENNNTDYSLTLEIQQQI